MVILLQDDTYFMEHRGVLKELDPDFTPGTFVENGEVACVCVGNKIVFHDGQVISLHRVPKMIDICGENTYIIFVWYENSFEIFKHDKGIGFMSEGFPKNPVNVSLIAPTVIYKAILYISGNGKITEIGIDHEKICKKLTEQPGNIIFSYGEMVNIGVAPRFTISDYTVFEVRGFAGIIEKDGKYLDIGKHKLEVQLINRIEEDSVGQIVIMYKEYIYIVSKHTLKLLTNHNLLHFREVKSARKV